MARLLTDHDYLKTIQEDNLNQIIEETRSFMLDAEQAAQSEMIGYLSQRYKVAEIFTNTTTFDATATYYAKNLVQLNADDFNDAASYVLNDLVVESGNVYHAPGSISAGAFDAGDWDLLGPQYAFFYVTLPEDEFDLETEYAAGSDVWYNNHTYTSTKACVGILPTDTAFWTDNGEYSITGELVTDDSVWTSGDNRNQLIVLHLVNITLYHLHHRINPRNVPELRRIAYDGNGDIKNAGSAINWLNMVAKGNVNADLPNIQPSTGTSIQYGNANDSETFSKNMLW